MAVLRKEKVFRHRVAPRYAWALATGRLPNKSASNVGLNAAVAAVFHHRDMVKRTDTLAATLRRDGKPSEKETSDWMQGLLRLLRIPQHAA